MTGGGKLLFLSADYLICALMFRVARFTLGRSPVSYAGITLRQNLNVRTIAGAKGSLAHSIRPGARCYGLLSQKNPLTGNLYSRRWTHSTASAIQPPIKAVVVPSRAVGYWLLSCSALVLAIVVVGGVTRLTESGLSITEWKPITGIVFPRTAEQWQQEYEKYSQSPEFKIMNSSMTVEDFKRIYFMEWFHRILGRSIGLAFVLPAGYFLLRGRIQGRDRLLALSGAALIGFQGFLGWYMVRSGLELPVVRPSSSQEGITDPNVIPRVSQYRLAAHLGTAFVLYAGMLWRGLSILSDRKPGSVKLALPVPRAFRTATLLTTGLVFLTAMSGAFVAGLDAGLIYNEFPYMGEGLAPPRTELFRIEPWWRNVFENPSLVQLDHRVFGMTAYTSVMTLFLASLRSKWRETLPASTRRALQLTVLAANVQVLLGISTLLYLVPTELAAAHQAGSVFLLSALLALGVTMRRPGMIRKIVR